MKMDNLIYDWLLEMLPTKELDLDLDLKSVHEMIISTWAKDSPGYGCIFITPEGMFLNLFPLLMDHNRLCDWVERQLECGQIMNDATWFTDNLNYIRCRNDRSMYYIVLPEKITSKQLYAIQEWLEGESTHKKLCINIPGGDFKTYDIAEYFPEDLIKIIKRFYSSGRLYENTSKKTSPKK
jgi:hypothetical protein